MVYEYDLEDQSYGNKNSNLCEMQNIEILTQRNELRHFSPFYLNFAFNHISNIYPFVSTNKLTHSRNIQI